MSRSIPATIVETAGAPKAHVQGTWGTVPPGLWAMNPTALAAAGPLWSSDHLCGHRLEAMTTADRSETRMMRPHDEI